jgi:hypothetical protein
VYICIDFFPRVLMRLRLCSFLFSVLISPLHCRPPSPKQNWVEEAGHTANEIDERIREVHTIKKLRKASSNNNLSLLFQRLVTCACFPTAWKSKSVVSLSSQQSRNKVERSEVKSGHFYSS